MNLVNPWNEKELKEACGIFACWNNENSAYTTYYGLHALQHRGQDACGIIWLNNENRLNIHKSLGLLRDVFTEHVIQKMQGHAAIGHTRYATTGDVGMKNVQPFYFKHKDNEFGLAHNGNVSNSIELRHELEDAGSVFFGTSDTELFGHYLIRNGKENLFESLLNILPKFEGAFSIILIDKNGIYAARDKWGFRPLVLGQEGNSYYFASETCGLDIVNAKLIRDIKPGEVMAITKDGVKSEFYAKPFEKQQLCAMELIYFSRPDSIIEGINVHSFRKKCGAELAKLFSIKADIVVPVPDSSISAALGFAEQSKIPYEMGLVKNRYIARTFIEAEQGDRYLQVNQKLNASNIVKGKDIILIDDSIVRGTTITQIIAMLKKVGAKKVHVRVASPMIIAPSYYGINISTYKELIANQFKNKDDLQKSIGADSLEYLPINVLENLASPVGLDTCIFTNNYITKISPKFIESAKK